MTAATAQRGPVTAGLLGPACVILLLVFIVPIGMLMARSVFDPVATVRNFAQLVASSVYVDVLLISLKLAAVSTVLALLWAYPVAYVLAATRGGMRSFLLLLVLLPFWTNILVRCYAWMLVLQVKGLINLTLVDWLHLLPRPIPLVFNFAGAVIGMVHYLMPVAVLMLDANMRTIDRRIIRAADSLGASPWRSFLYVFLPQTWSGLRAAGVLTFISALGSFVIPALLGGREDMTVAMLINSEFSETMNWGFGAALATALLLVTLALLIGFHAVPARRMARP